MMLLFRDNGNVFFFVGLYLCKTFDLMKNHRSVGKLNEGFRESESKRSKTSTKAWNEGMCESNKSPQCTLFQLTTDENKSLHFIRDMTRDKDESKKRRKEKRKEKEREILENGSILYQTCSTDPFNQMKRNQAQKETNITQ